MMKAYDPADNARPLSIAQLVLSIINLAMLSLAFISLVILLLIAPEMQDFSIDQVNQLSGMLWIILAAFVLTLPSLISSIRRISGKPVRMVPRGLFLVASIALVLMAPVVLLGNHLSGEANGQWLFGVINILLVFVPLWWLLELGRLRLAKGSTQRQWGVSTFSIYVTLPVVMVVELVILGFSLLLAEMWLVQQPEFTPLLRQIEQAFSNGSFELQRINFDWLPLLQKPGVIIAIVVGASLVVPLIEELLKPLGVWVLIKRGITPAGGFVAGMICGASFALLESLFSLSAVGGEEWFYAVAGRAGTGLLHLTLTGYNGWALASSWKDGKEWRVGLTYMITVLVHGTWNLFAMVMGLSMVGEELQLGVNPELSASASWVLGALALALLASLIVMNLRLRRTPDKHPVTMPPPLPFAPGGLE